jgi:exodeoxyribonuclease VII small subunit
VVAAAPGSSGKSERPPYEQARDELTELVKRLEAGGLTLEQSLQLWERGEKLAAICEDWLEGARARLTTALAQHEQARHDQAQPQQAQHEQAQQRRDRAGRDQDQQDPGAPF